MSRDSRRRAAALGCLLAALSLLGPGQPLAAEPIAVAVLDLDTGGAPELGPAGGAGLADLLAVALSARAGIRLVEREMLRRALDEQTLGLAGVVEPTTAARVRRLVGAQVLVTGRVFVVANRLVVTARLIGAETGHVEAVAEEGRRGRPTEHLIDGLAEKIGRLLAERDAAFVGGGLEAPALTGEKRFALTAPPAQR